MELGQDEGHLYVASRDDKFRPILVLSLKNFPLARIEREETQILESFVYFIKIVKEYMLLPYYIESFKIIIDVAKQDLLPYSSVILTKYFLFKSVIFFQDIDNKKNSYKSFVL